MLAQFKLGICSLTGPLILSALQTKTHTFANSVDPDDMAGNVSSIGSALFAFPLLIFDWHSYLQQCKCLKFEPWMKQ